MLSAQVSVAIEADQMAFQLYKGGILSQERLMMPDGNQLVKMLAKKLFPKRLGIKPMRYEKVQVSKIVLRFLNLKIGFCRVPKLDFHSPQACCWSVWAIFSLVF